MIQKFTPYLFAFTLFVSAMLVFSVQPMLGKMMLPHVGGAPSGWAVTMFFFQTCLLFGYGLAFILSKLSPLPNILAIVALFLIATIFLPLSYSSDVSSTISPWAVFVQLTVTTAIPFLALSTISPGLQKLFSFSNHKTAKDPYYLYAASNAGSFVGLFAYPFFMEPLLGLSEQSELWMSVFFGLFILLFLCFSFVFLQRKDLFKLTPFFLNTPQSETSEAITWSRRFNWLMLAAIPSSLMIGTTMKITTDVASAPMIWVLPLGLYLLTTIIAFGKRNIIKTDKLAAFHLIGITIAFCIILIKNQISSYNQYLFVFAAIFLTVFVITAQLLHNQLANDRPKTDKLTEFYLIMALGGAIGGSFNAFIAPFIFNDVYEFPLMLILSLAFTPAFKQKVPQSLKKLLLFISALLLVMMGAHHLFNVPIILNIICVLLFVSAIHPRLLALCCLAVLIYSSFHLGYSKISFKDRNFFGVVTIAEKPVSASQEEPVKAIIHGTTLHGFEIIDEKYKYIPSSYYALEGPVGFVYRELNPKKITVLGLGAGQLACYNKYNGASRQTTFYEIDPTVVKVAKENFTLLDECGYEDIILGDARLELAKDPNNYDLIVADVFSSDSVPIHIITNEAVQLYKSKLNDNGALLFNISNRHMNLKDPLAAIAQKNNLQIRTDFFIPSEEDTYHYASEWVVMTNNQNLLNKMDAGRWQNIKSTSRPWTDDYSNLLSTLRILNRKSTPTLEIEEE